MIKIDLLKNHPLVKQSLSDRCIIDCLQVHYDIKVVTLTFLPLGADTNAYVYKAETMRAMERLK